ncbi:helix-turn-helix domain-containing protein [Sulfobacillus thermosulfidooxidans]|uniref:helix-turn-helix domain-containing protein n=1 Tax=Sulfobacillus thermosulfidooxidans TaxID=28034 RepID=UPI0006B60E45|nr:helix-turn-helix transcriptional regulator [Sulfobacillus thermosulfidooxidans]
MDWMYPRIGHRIRELRESHGLTQGQLAEQVNLTRTSIVNIEQGRQKVMIHTLYQLAMVFNVPVADLLPAFDESSPLVQVKTGVLQKDELAFFERTVGQRLQRRENT